MPKKKYKLNSHVKPPRSFLFLGIPQRGFSKSPLLMGQCLHLDVTSMWHQTMAHMKTSKSSPAKKKTPKSSPLLPPHPPPFLKNFRIWHKHLVLTLLSLDHGHIGISTAGGIFLAHSTSSPRQETPSTTMEIPQSLGEKINAQCIAMETRQGNELPAEAKLGLWINFFFDWVNLKKMYRICLLT